MAVNMQLTCGELSFFHCEGIKLKYNDTRSTLVSLAQYAMLLRFDCESTCPWDIPTFINLHDYLVFMPSVLIHATTHWSRIKKIFAAACSVILIHAENLLMCHHPSRWLEYNALAEGSGPVNSYSNSSQESSTSSGKVQTIANISWQCEVRLQSCGTAEYLLA